MSGKLETSTPFFFRKCEYDPKKPVRLDVKNKKRDINDFFSIAPRQENKLKLNDKKKGLDYADVLLPKNPHVLKSSLEVKPAKNPFAISELVPTTEDIEYKYNLKLFYDIMRDFYRYLRYVLVREIQRRRPSYFTKKTYDLNSRIITYENNLSTRGTQERHTHTICFLLKYWEFKQLTSSKGLLSPKEKDHPPIIDKCSSVMKPNTEFFQYEQNIVADRTSPQIDNAFIRKREFRTLENYDWTQTLKVQMYDSNYKIRFLNGFSTNYNYNDVMIKPAAPPQGKYIDPVDPDTATLTPFSRFSDTLYLYRIKDRKFAYESVMLNCIRPTKGNQIMIDVYLEKARKVIIQFRKDISSYAIVLSSTLKENPVASTAESICPDLIQYNESDVIVESFFGYVYRLMNPALRRKTVRPFLSVLRSY